MKTRYYCDRCDDEVKESAPGLLFSNNKGHEMFRDLLPSISVYPNWCDVCADEIKKGLIDLRAIPNE